MSTTELRSTAHELIDKIDDQFLVAVLALMDTYVKEKSAHEVVVGYDIYGEPKKAEATMTEYENRLAATKENGGITIDQLKEESKKWRSTK